MGHEYGLTDEAGRPVSAWAKRLIERGRKAHRSARRAHLADQKYWSSVPQSEEHGQKTDNCTKTGAIVFYRWQKEFFENGAASFQQRGRTNHQPEQERIAYLEKKIQTKDEVLAELMAEHVALKKRVGEL